MPQRDLVSWSTITAAYAHLGRLVDAKKIFDLTPQQCVLSWNTIVAAFSSNGHLDYARFMFDRMPHRNVISWNAILGAYASAGFVEMTDNIFQSMDERDSVSWNSLISGYSHRGHGCMARETFRAMVLNGFSPDSVTLLAILSACSVDGRLQDSWNCYTYATQDFGIVRTGKHVLRGGSGKCGLLSMVEETTGFLVCSSSTVNPIPWTIMLGASKMHDDVRRGRMAVEKLMELEPENFSSYVAFEPKGQVPNETSQMGIDPPPTAPAPTLPAPPPAPSLS
ncbi:pentatricopeptide repeat-containing protein At4g02750 [Selaginella moellendorffii]|uniref:pentatricopeptide repeat-containing protein At4g02750 n=1 Tax=Selaginella moellendorffii TaxID=88036 RepID=UPI000D1C8325|nr:pentatricopeptide repeat-containing protein At4g02750 [Selaginella moellendorffii]|eukprot:XP_002965069.2 pentatricopeptide repeat-containing protein At4g02750 [Selaginella moellendorffii]